MVSFVAIGERTKEARGIKRQEQLLTLGRIYAEIIHLGLGRLLAFVNGIHLHRGLRRAVPSIVYY